MTAVVAIVVAVALAVVVWLLQRVARSRAAAGHTDSADRLEGELVGGLLAQLEEQRQETAYWRTAAQRLQRELDGRGDTGS
jgi:hypothetical protein